MTNHIDLKGPVTIEYDKYEFLTNDQKLIVNRAFNALNFLVEEINEDDRVLHIYGVEPGLIKSINAYNRTQRGPNGAPINITSICNNALEDALEDALEQERAVWDEPALEMEDDDD